MSIFPRSSASWWFPVDTPFSFNSAATSRMNFSKKSPALGGNRLPGDLEAGQAELVDEGGAQAAVHGDDQDWEAHQRLRDPGLCPADLFRSWRSFSRVGVGTAWEEQRPAEGSCRRQEGTCP
jgi:hypothetical protein